MSPVDDLVAWRTVLAARELRRVHPAIAIDAPDADPALEERVEDAVRSASMSEAFHEARSAPPGRDGDRARTRLRVAAPVYLDRAEPALEAALRDRREAASGAWGGDVDAALAAEGDALRRRSVAAAFAETLERLAALERERLDARDAAARRTGAADAHELLGAAWTPGGTAAASEIERGFIAPLDDAIGSAMRERARSSGAAAEGPLLACDVPRLAWLPEARPLGAPQAVPRALRRLGGALGLDPDADGARLEAVGDPPAAPSVHERLASRAVVVLGTWGGPRGFVDACAAFGRAQRASFLARTRGAGAADLADPAFAQAAETLFRRIGASEAGLALAGIVLPGTVLRDLRLEETVAARSAWAALAAACDPRGDRSAAAIRAGARPVAPGAAHRAERDDADPWARLRGIAFGVLLEERLLTRFGRAWWVAPRAGSLLCDQWAAEPDEGPESMAAALGLGTMDSSPLLEAYGPRKGRVS